MRGSHLVTLGKLVLASALVTGCGALGGNPPSNPGNAGVRPATVVTVAKAVTGPISQEIGYTGTVQAADSVNVAPLISGRITKLTVNVGSSVKAGDLIAELDKSTLNAQVEQAQTGVDAANVKLAQIQAGARPEAADAAAANARSAQAKLDAIQAGARSETVAQAKANLDAAQAKLALIQAGPRSQNVATAKANLDAAVAKLQQLKSGPTSDQVAAQQLIVQQNQNSVYAANANRDGVCGNQKNPKYQCDQAQAQVAAAQTALNAAQQNLKTLTDPPAPDAVNQAQAAVDAARQQYLLAQQPYTAPDLAQAQAAVDAAAQAYKLAQTPYTAQDVAQAQAAANAAADQAKLAAQPFTNLDQKAAQVAVSQAQAALDLAKTNLLQAEILAPFDGVVTAKFLSVGALASPNTPIVSLMSPHLEVQFSIDQANIGSVKAGQTVSLVTAAYAGQMFPATVASVYPSADPKTHTFTVVVDPRDTSGALRAGMFITLNVTVASFPSATLIPSVAIIQRGAQSVVFVVTNNVAHQTPVQVGIADDTNTQIRSGVKVGDEVVTINQASLSDGSPVRIAPGTGAPASGGAPANAGRRAGGTAPNGSRPIGSPTPAKAG